MRLNTLAKPFTIAGFVAGEILMIFTALAPNLKGGPPPPLEALIQRCLALGLFFGPFGAAAGLGVWLLAIALWSLIVSVRQMFRGAKPARAEARNAESSADYAD